MAENKSQSKRLNKKKAIAKSEKEIRDKAVSKLTGINCEEY